MRTAIHSLAVVSTLALTVSAVLPAFAPAAHANPATPEKLWDGFSAPTGIAVHSDGAIYVSNWGGGSVEKIASDGVRSTILNGIASPAGKGRLY